MCGAGGFSMASHTHDAGRSLPRWIWYLSYLILSSVGLYYLRLGTASKETGRYMEAIMTGRGEPRYPRQDIDIRKHYTGITGLDAFLEVLVTAFLARRLGTHHFIQLQQSYFLVSWYSVLTVWSVESVRMRNGWSVIVL